MRKKLPLCSQKYGKLLHCETNISHGNCPEKFQKGPDKSKWVGIVNYSSGKRGLSLKGGVVQERGGRGQLWPLDPALSQRRCQPTTLGPTFLNYGRTGQDLTTGNKLGANFKPFFTNIRARHLFFLINGSWWMMQSGKHTSSGLGHKPGVVLFHLSPEQGTFKHSAAHRPGKNLVQSPCSKNIQLL